MQSTSAAPAIPAASAVPDVEQQRQSLKAIQQMTQSLIDCKSTLLQKTEALEYKQKLLEDIVAERQRLNKERRTLLDMMQNVQRDLESVTEAEASLIKEHGALQQSVTRLRNEEYEPLHDRVNHLRTSNGLKKIPHVQQEVDAQMARILEERRQNWQHGGVGGPSPSSVSSTSHASRSRRHR